MPPGRPINERPKSDPLHDAPDRDSQGQSTHRDTGATFTELRQRRSDVVNRSLDFLQPRDVVGGNDKDVIRQALAAIGPP